MRLQVISVSFHQPRRKAMLDNFRTREIFALIALCLFMAGFELPLALIKTGVSYDVANIVAQALWVVAFSLAVIAVALWIIEWFKRWRKCPR